jgi:UDP:flavonoid glycosyltransferase YjiC (YdhE family)
MVQKTFAFFPEAAFGPALNSVGIAQAVEARGHKAVFLSDPGFVEVYRGYGFEAHPVNLSAPMPPEQMAKFWEDFINGHIPNFRKSPYDQVDTYVKDCWTAIVDSAKWAQKDLPGVLAKIRPDVICVDNVILFPAIKQYGKPWVRIISCSGERDRRPEIPPHLSGCGAKDFKPATRPIASTSTRSSGRSTTTSTPSSPTTGEAPYPTGEFFEASPYLNLLLYPEPVKFERKRPLDPARFQYLEGCVRKEAPYEVPAFAKNADGPLVYVSFGSLGAGDTELLKRIISAIGTLALPRAGQCRRLQGRIHGRARQRDRGKLVSPALGDPAGRCGHPPRRQQLVHRMPLLRKAGDHHALRLGRPRQRDARPGDRPRLQDASLRLDRRGADREAGKLHRRCGDEGEAGGDGEAYAGAERAGEGGGAAGRAAVIRWSS